MKTGRKPRFKVAQVEEALRQSGGVYTLAANRLGTSRQSIANYVKRHPSLVSALDEIQETTLDIAEAGLLKHLQDGDKTAIFYILNNKGKSRGYQHRVAVDATVNGLTQEQAVDGFGFD